MKKAIFMLTAMVALVLVSCGKSNEDLIKGTWKMTDLKMNMPIPADQKAAFDAAMEEQIKNTSYEFTEDGKMILNTPRGKETGKYSVKDKKLNTEFQGKKEALDIKALTDKNLELSITVEGETVSMKFEK